MLRGTLAPASHRTVAGILVARQEGQLYVFDRGCAYPVEVSHPDVTVQYDPRFKHSNGVYGQSIVGLT
jgi:hypothetical protein